MIKQNHIHFATDGSMHYNDSNMKVYGMGGEGIEVYYEENEIDMIILPTSMRTHMNVAKLMMMNITIQYITEEPNWKIWRYFRKISFI